MTRFGRRFVDWWAKRSRPRGSGAVTEASHGRDRDLRNRLPPDLQRYAERLGRSAWGTREASSKIKLVLAPHELLAKPDPAAMVETMLAHVRRVAPALNVPDMTPRVVTGPLAGAAGLFSEQDGWVTITVPHAFFADRLAARAILCHELAHYVLNANGLGEPGQLANKRLTDVAMFAFGLGDIFLAGYWTLATEYRPGHKLGYLSEAEYQMLDQLVLDLHVSGRLLATKADRTSPGAEKVNPLAPAVRGAGVPPPSNRSND